MAAVPVAAAAAGAAAEGAVGVWAAGVLLAGCGLTGGCSLPGTYWPMNEPSSVNCPEKDFK